jgi:outer membrane murein-binding lipoprotein Lpp
MKPSLSWISVVTAVIAGVILGTLALSGHAQLPPPQAPGPKVLPTEVPTTPRVSTQIETNILTLQNTVKQLESSVSSLTARVLQLETRLSSAESKLAIHETKISLLCKNQLSIPLGLPGVKLDTC